MSCQATIPKHDDTATEYDTSLLAQVLTSRLMLCNHRSSQRARAHLGHGKGPDWPQGKKNSPQMQSPCPPPLLRSLPAYSARRALLLTHPPPCSTAGLTPTLRNARLGTPIAASAHAPGPFLMKTHRQLGRACIGLGRMGPQMRTAFQRACSHSDSPSHPPASHAAAGTVAWGKKGGGSAGCTQQAGPTTEAAGHGRWKRGLGQGRSRPHAFDDPRTRPPGQGSRYHK